MKKSNEEVNTIFNLLGIDHEYLGLKFLKHILELSCENEEVLTNITKLLYADTAEAYKTSIYCVERDVRTIINVIWEKGNRKILENIFGKELDKCPSNGDFICRTTAYLMRHQAE